MNETQRRDTHNWERDSPLLTMAGRLARFGGWSVGVPSGEVYWSTEMFSMLGFDEGSGTPALETALALYPDPDRERIQGALERCMADGTPLSFEGVILNRAGEQLHVRAVGEAVRGELGVITAVQGAFYDISEIVAEREERIAAQETLRRALDYIPDMICFVDSRWRLTFANTAAIAFSQLTEEQLISATIWELFPDLAESGLRVGYERAMTERSSSTHRAFLPQFGRWVEATAHPIHDGIALLVRDVSDERERQREFSELTERAIALSAMLDISDEAFITEDLDNRVTYWNAGAELIYGWTKDEAIGRNIRELIYADAAPFEPAAAELLATGKYTGELHQFAKDGRPLIVECRWQAMLDDAGRPVSLFAVNSDVTELRRQQEVRTRAQRLESLGTLAGGIAHDLNNVLTPVLMSIQLLRSDPLSPEQESLLAGMEGGVLRGAEMIRQVLSFARGVEGARDTIAVDDLIGDLSTLTLAVLPKSIDVTLDVPEVPSIAGDATQINQVLVNLVTNARDAMPDGGQLRIAASPVEVREPSAFAAVLAQGTYVTIAVSDTGTGMSHEVQSKIFDPFFTTKGIGEGTGLGLASSQAIARSHGGYIAVDSEVGRGSVFTLYLPIAADVSTESSTSSTSPTPVRSGRGELILVVDDEPGIRESVSQTLKKHGYHTIEAANGREAIEVFNKHADEVRLVLTDMMMPVMDGAAIAAYFSEHHPDVPVVASSGLSAAAAVDRAREVGVEYFLAKPYLTETLLRTVHEALG